MRLVVITDLCEAAGGATSLAIASAVAGRRRDLPVTYISSAGTISPALIAAGVTMSLIPGDIIRPGQKLRGFVDGLYRQASARHLADWIAANDTHDTVYHLHNWSRFLSPSVLGVLRKVQDRLVCTTHDFFLTCPNGAQYSFRDEALCARRPNGLACLGHNCDRRSYAQKLWRSGRHALRQSLFGLDGGASFIAIHDAMIPSLVLGGMPRDRIVVVRNPIRPFTPDRITVEHNRNVVFVGRISSEKGPDLAAAAAERAGLPIDFIGDGPMVEDLRQRYPDARFHGWKTRDEIGAICRTARMLVMPSRWVEPYGMVAGEALWSGLPVIASDNAYLAPEIAAAGAGLAVATRDTAAFAGAMHAIASDDGLARRMSEQAFTATGHLGKRLDAWENACYDLYAEKIGSSL